MIFKTTGKSIEELLKIYGTGLSGFYPQDWYKKEKFFTEKPEAGEYEIDFETDLTNKTFDEQVNSLKEGFKPIHPAILCEAILSYYKETGKRLLENVYSQTNTLDVDGDHVRVGGFDSDGLNVSNYSNGVRDYVGLSAGKKLSSDSETITHTDSLNHAIEVVKDAGYIIFKPI